LKEIEIDVLEGDIENRGVVSFAQDQGLLRGGDDGIGKCDGHHTVEWLDDNPVAWIALKTG
jgi:hypothetical protein